jgi:hypothetical protein
MSELLDRDEELVGCMKTDPSRSDEYKAVLYRDGFIQGNRFFAYMPTPNNCKTSRSGKRTNRQPNWQATEKAQINESHSGFSIPPRQCFRLDCALLAVHQVAGTQ